MQIAHIKGGLMADTIVPVPDGVGIFESEPTREKRNKGGRGAVQATTGNDSIGLMIIQVLSGERAKLRVEWQEWRGEWRGRGQEEQENGRIKSPTCQNRVWGTHGRVPRTASNTAGAGLMRSSHGTGSQEL